MSSINSVKNLQVLYFRRINKKIKKLKKDKKKCGLALAVTHTTGAGHN